MISWRGRKECNAASSKTTNDVNKQAMIRFFFNKLKLIKITIDGV
jgi:hypothetical protein